VRPPATPITVPFRRCTRCGHYKPVIAGSRPGSFIQNTQRGGRGIAVPFVCLGCNRSVA
jgi:hypothetical protein